jgi:hypothetical protein
MEIKITGLISLKKYQQAGLATLMVNLEELLKLLPVMAIGSDKSLIHWIGMGQLAINIFLWRKKIHDQFFFNKNNKL